MPHPDSIIYFSFYEIQLQVQSLENELLERLKKDFSFFYREKIQSKPDYRVDIFKERPDFSRLPQKTPIFNREQSITYENGDYLYNDYHGEALTILDDVTNIFAVYSDDIHRLHEVSYLFILSVVGKKLDLLGLHRLHACGFRYKGQSVLCTADTGIGKTTLLLNLISNRDVQIYSDDTPLISAQGHIHPMPTRFGLNSGDSYPLNLDANAYELRRKKLSPKNLVDFKLLNNAVASVEKCSVLAILARSKTNSFSLNKTSKFRMFFYLFKNLVIGVGTPIIFEYFWRTGVKDFLIKTKIFFKRLKTAFKLLCVSDCYIILLSKDHYNNSQKILEWLAGRKS